MAPLSADQLAGPASFLGASYLTANNANVHLQVAGFLLRMIADQPNTGVPSTIKLVRLNSNSVFAEYITSGLPGTSFRMTMSSKVKYQLNCADEPLLVNQNISWAVTVIRCGSSKLNLQLVSSSFDSVYPLGTLTYSSNFAGYQNFIQVVNNNLMSVFRTLANQRNVRYPFAPFF